HMAMESKKAYGFLFQISTKTNKKELAIKPLLFVYSLRSIFIYASFFVESINMDLANYGRILVLVFSVHTSCYIV
ncbi:hypothetical protein, partial [Enterococcus faecium]|uniref:hypothetical protein n=1 Tax=Enterococcus faecium TaxID=1352 RepID=UPI00248B8B47